MTNSPESKDNQPKTGLRQFLIGVLIAVLPVLIAILTTPPGSNPLSEGPSSSGGGGGAAIWFSLFTLPIGAVIAITSFRKMTPERAKRVRKASCFSCLGFIVLMTASSIFMAWLANR